MTTASELSNEEKVGLLRSLCQGYGVRPETFVEKEDELRALVDTNADNMRCMFERSAEAMTPGKYKDAFLNALWARDNKNLTDRRTEFIAREGDITYRTLVRHEQEGAEVFLKFLEAEARSSSSPYRIEEEDDYNVDLEAMRMRIAKLESLVWVLTEQLKKVNTAVHFIMLGKQEADLYHKDFIKAAKAFNYGADGDGRTLTDHLFEMPAWADLHLRFKNEEESDKSDKDGE